MNYFRIDSFHYYFLLKSKNILTIRPIDRLLSTDLISVILKNKVDLNDVISIERDSP